MGKATRKRARRKGTYGVDGVKNWASQDLNGCSILGGKVKSWSLFAEW